jgi:hypothetical protein
VYLKLYLPRVEKGEWSQTHDGQRFLLYKTEHMIIYTTDTNLEILANSDMTAHSHSTTTPCRRLAQQAELLRKNGPPKCLQAGGSFEKRAARHRYNHS